MNLIDIYNLNAQKSPKKRPVHTRRVLSVLAACAALCAHPGITCAQIFVTNFVSGTIGEYDAVTGATINSALISGLDSPYGLALSGKNLFVVNEGGTVGKYTTSGATVNASLISGLTIPPVGIAVSGGNLFVTDLANGTIGEYTTSGAVVNTSLVSGLNSPFGIAVSGGKLFVVNEGNGTIGVYDAVTGAVINSALVSGLTDPRDIAVSGKHLFVSNNSTATSLGFIGEYDAITGTAIDSELIEAIAGPRGIALVGGNLLVANTFGNSIDEFTKSGVLIGPLVFNQGLSGPEHIVVSGVPDSGPGAVRVRRGSTGNALSSASDCRGAKIFISLTFDRR
jgi:hypothetical protein